MSIIGFIGVGNMGGALARAAAKHKENTLLLADFLQEKAENLAKEIGATASENEGICRTAKYIFLGVKPQVLPELLQTISPILAERKGEFILVSMAAGVEIKKITEQLGFSPPIIRIMPNLPVSVNEGMVLYTANSKVQKTDINELIEAMEASGKWDGMDETFINAGCAVSGCGPAFCFMFAKALADGAVNCGLDYNSSIKYAAQTMKGAAEMLLYGGDADTLTKAVCSPGGSTSEGVKVLQAEELAETVKDAVEASYKRTIELGK